MGRTLHDAEFGYCVGTLFMRAQKIIKDAQVLFFAPPMIPGYSASSDIELNMQDKTGGDLNHFYDVVLDYMDALKARPEINSAQTTFNPSFPQYMLDIDAAACKKAGISPSDILTTMQGYFGGLYASNFNRFGKMYRVMIQAEPEATKNLESLNSIKIRNGNEMAPISQFVSVKKVYGPDVIGRFNLYTSIKVMVLLPVAILPDRLCRLLRKLLKRICLPVTVMSWEVWLVKRHLPVAVPQVSSSFCVLYSFICC